MILILCHLHDADAAWLCQRLQQADLPVLIVSADELLFAREVRHTLGRAGDNFSITLQNGRHIEKEDVTFVINRLYYLDPIIWKNANPKQYQYVAQEINALFLSLLYSIGADRVYNPPTPASLGGRHLSPAEWQLLGVRAGLPIAPHWPPSETTPFPVPDARLLVLDGNLLGTLPTGITPDACRQLARQSGTNLLELQFTQLPSGCYVFAGATVFATLHHYGDKLIQHFVNLTNYGSDLGHSERVADPAFA